MMKRDDEQVEKARRELLDAKVAHSRAKANGDPDEIARLGHVVEAARLKWLRLASVPS